MGNSASSNTFNRRILDMSIMVPKPVDGRVAALFEERFRDGAQRTDRMFRILMLIQWAAAIAVSVVASPLAWAGRDSAPHLHVYAATVLGGLVTLFPMFVVQRYPGTAASRWTLACGQMMWSALLIHLTGGRIETHFHIFGSLAFLAFYRDAELLIPATLVIAGDHFIRGIVWPESIYGVSNPEWWRFLEHAGWVAFIDVFLIYNCVKGRRELYEHCEQQVALEDASEASARMEKLAAVGQLAASVGHELRNPLGAIRNAHSFIERKLDRNGIKDPKILQFMLLISRELDASGKIIANLLDFSRPKEPTKSACAMRPLITEAIGIVPPLTHVQIMNSVSGDLPLLDLDKDQLRQVFVNLVQNAAEAIPNDVAGRVKVSSKVLAEIVRISVTDNGPGIPVDAHARIFQPLFSTKVKGTGLGLAVTAGIIRRHGGEIRVRSDGQNGTTMEVDLPINRRQTNS
jgi:two-component system sensor histidine kinase HydH